MLKGLQLIINTATSGVHPWLDLAEKALAAGGDGIQLRHKTFFDRATYLLAQQLAELCRHYRRPFIINDRLDIALAVNATGVHLGEEDMPVATARHLLGQEKIIGATASHLAAATAAVAAGADYIGFGHIFATPSKCKEHPPLGIAPLQEICQQLPIPVIAIGGIHQGNLAQVCAAAIAGVAVISAISGSVDPFSQTQKMKEILHAHGIE